MTEFEKIIEQVESIWEVQKEKVNAALLKKKQYDDLMDEAEDLEKQMYDLLQKAKEINPEAFDEYLNSFAPEEEVKND